MLPLAVYCYLRPTTDEVNYRNVNSSSIPLSCRAIGPDTVVLIPPANNHRIPSEVSGQSTETRYIFHKVFDAKTTNSKLFMEVCTPLLTDVLTGRDALLFTYGASGSGKTHLMCGTSEEPGILPRCIDTIFNSITLMDKYCLSKNPSTNEFTLVTDADRMLERQKRDLLPSILNKIKKDGNHSQSFAKSCAHHPSRATRACFDDSKLFCVSTNSRFAVFVSYIEIYNRYVYDLLDECADRQIRRSKILKEDRSGRMFVRDGIEIEVRSTDEAIRIMKIGNSMRQTGNTDVNLTSSRSHAVFTIRLVRIDNTLANEEDKIACISQLSLVDMAGSERNSKSNTEGARLREAGSINASLLILRNCFRALQSQPSVQSNMIVPYRDCKLTLMFKHFFEGYGRIVMLICVNPSESNYDENVHVMKFAEASQEIKVIGNDHHSKPLNIVSIKSTASAPKRPLTSMDENTPRKISKTQDADLERFTKHGKIPSSIELREPLDENTLPEMCQFLDERSKELKLFLERQIAEVRYLREFLTRVINEKQMLKAEIATFRNSEAIHRLAISDLKCQLRQSNIELQNIRARQTDQNHHIQSKEIKDQAYKIEQQVHEITHLRAQIDDLLKQKDLTEAKYRQEINEIKTDARLFFDREIQRQNAAFSSEVLLREAKLRRVKEILTSDEDNGSCVTLLAKGIPHVYRAECMITPQSNRISRYASSSITNVTPLTTTVTPFPSSSVPHDNRMVVLSPISQKRSSLSNKLRWRSADVWLDHRPRYTVRTDGLLQPSFRKHRSVSCVSLANTKSANKYALTDQLHTREGDIITRLFKGEILESQCGGANVVFTDVETVRLESPRSKLSYLTDAEPSFSSGTADSSNKAPNENGYNDLNKNEAPRRSRRFESPLSSH